MSYTMADCPMRLMPMNASGEIAVVVAIGLGLVMGVGVASRRFPYKKTRPMMATTSAATTTYCQPFLTLPNTVLILFQPHSQPVLPVFWRALRQVLHTSAGLPCC